MKKIIQLIILMSAMALQSHCQNIGAYPAYTFSNIDKSYLALYDSTHTYNVSSHTYKWSLAQLKTYLSSSGFGAGTVTSIATGLGLSGGTITGAGTLLVDTASASILSRQRAVNTYQPIGSYLTTAVTSVATGYGLSGGTITTTGTLIADTTSSGALVSKTRLSNAISTFGTGSVTSVSTGLGLSGGTITTTGTLLVDTASASILSRQRAANTYAPISITGTVTSVATGLGLSGGTITSTGTLLVDTASASILSRQRAVNTYSPIAGSTSITTLGTITTGTWNGTSIAVANGGTGATTAITALSNLGMRWVNMTSSPTTTSNVAANVTDMVASLEANKVYNIDMVLNIACNNTGGVKIAFTIPAGTTFRFAATGRANNATSPQMQLMTASGTLTTNAYCTANTDGFIIIKGTVTTTGTTGNLQLQWASGTNTQTSTIYQEGTYMQIVKTN